MAIGNEKREEKAQEPKCVNLLHQLCAEKSGVPLDLNGSPATSMHVMLVRLFFKEQTKLQISMRHVKS